MTAQAAATLRQQHELLNQAQAAGLDLTPQQRAEIEQLGAAMVAAEDKTRQLTQAQQGAQQAGQFLGDGLTNSFADVILGAQTAEDAIKGLVSQLARAAIQAALMGSGPLGGLTGGTGILSGLFGLKLAGGGEVRGPGTSTSDSIPAMLSDGEHVIRASEARKHRALLNAINAGQLPRLASGGIVGKVPALPGARVSAPSVTISAPITIHGSAGTPAQNADLARQMGEQLENTVRSIVGDEMANAMRPGGFGNQRVG